LGVCGLRFWEACGILCREIDNEADHGDRLEFDAPDSEAMDLDHSRQRRRRADQQPARMVFYVSAIVRNQPREGKGSLRGRVE
jgi:hypothetical protein